MGLELKPDMHPPITSQTRYTLHHAATFCELGIKYKVKKRHKNIYNNTDVSILLLSFNFAFVLPHLVSHCYLHVYT